MPSKARVKVTKIRTTKTAKVGKSRNKSGGNPNKCPVCGKFMGSGSHGQTQCENKKEVKTD